jgi:hypothetical protein
MNNWNPLELRKWKPRQPSPRVAARIFGTEPQGQLALDFHWSDVSRWIIPAFGCALLALATLSSHLPSRYSAQLAATNFVLPSLIEDNGTVTLPPAQGHSGVNGVPAKTLVWNFGARPAAQAVGSVGSMLISYTNKLIQ